jgi:hypothetical protein
MANRVVALIVGLERTAGEALRTATRAIFSDFTDPTLLEGYSKMVVGGMRMSTAIGPQAQALEPLIVAAEESLGVLQEINKGIIGMAQSVEGLSPEVTAATAETQVRLLMARFGRAAEIGDRLGKITELRGEMATTLTEISTNLAKGFLPIAEELLEKVVSILSWIKWMTDNLPLETVGTFIASYPDILYHVITGSPLLAIKDIKDLLDNIDKNTRPEDQQDQTVLDDIHKFLTSEIPTGPEYGGPPAPRKGGGKGGGKDEAAAGGGGP